MTLPRRVLHLSLITILAVQALYCFAQVLFVLQPAGGSPGPLFGASAEISHELLVARRLYAIEGWIAFGALAIYLGITEIRPALGRPDPSGGPPGE